MHRPSTIGRIARLGIVLAIVGVTFAPQTASVARTTPSAPQRPSVTEATNPPKCGELFHGGNAVEWCVYVVLYQNPNALAGGGSLNSISTHDGANRLHIVDVRLYIVDFPVRYSGGKPPTSASYVKDVTPRYTCQYTQPPIYDDWWTEMLFRIRWPDGHLSPTYTVESNIYRSTCA
jgi:hypothetical protein